MKLRNNVVELLHAGRSDREIAATLHTDARTVSTARATLGLPKARPGKRPAADLTTAFNARAKRARDGHMLWTGHAQNGMGTFRWQGRLWTARRAAFEIHNGRPPVGKALPSCGRAQCVAPAHMQDQTGRFEAVQAAKAARPAPPRDSIVEMLRGGHSAAEISRVLRVDAARVRRIRDELRLPPCKPGPKLRSIDEIFESRVTRTADGHLLWPTTNYRIQNGDGPDVSVTRYAFRQKHGRAPVGKVLPGCGTPRCVHPDHLEDRPMREALDSQLTAIFGSTR
ncbi:hypothetical protein [Streptomyces sp. NPDC048659]|uniref:hypothetical protein n=1 Tax=Streptomyces sp. NPDC048659 TaxID=3155489 RepID=UPI0034126587